MALDHGVDRFVEFGHRRVLVGLVRRIVPDVEAVHLGDPSDLPGLLAMAGREGSGAAAGCPSRSSPGRAGASGRRARSPWRRRGFDLGLTYARDREGAEAVAEAVRDAGGRATRCRARRATPAAPRAVVEEVEGALGPLDAIVANAGVTRDGPAVRMGGEAWTEPIDVNLTGTMSDDPRRPGGDGCAAGQGSVVALSSMVGVQGNAGQANYAASKAGIIGLVKALAREAGPRGARQRRRARLHPHAPHRRADRRAHRGPAARDGAGAAGRPGGRRGPGRVPVLAGVGLHHRRGAWRWTEGCGYEEATAGDGAWW